MATAVFITSNNKTLQSLNQRHLGIPCTGVDTMADSSQLTQGGSKVRRSCQSTIVGGACTELRHSDRNLKTAWFEKGDFKTGIKKKKNHWVDFYHYRMDVYTHFQYTFMFKQLVKWVLPPMTPLHFKSVPKKMKNSSASVMLKKLFSFRSTSWQVMAEQKFEVNLAS